VNIDVRVCFANEISAWRKKYFELLMYASLIGTGHAVITRKKSYQGAENKMRERKTRWQTAAPCCKGGKRRTGKRGTALQGGGTRETGKRGNDEIWKAKRNLTT